MVLAGMLLASVILLMSSGPFGRRDASSRPMVSLAVLEIANNSGEPELEYLSNGITEGLIRRLSQLPGMTLKVVRSRPSAKESDTRSISDRLSVQDVLSGHLDKENGKLSVTLELVDTSKNKSIWSDRLTANEYDETDLQNQIF